MNKIFTLSLMLSFVLIAKGQDVIYENPEVSYQNYEFCNIKHVVRTDSVTSITIEVLDRTNKFELDNYFCYLDGKGNKYELKSVEGLASTNPDSTGSIQVKLDFEPLPDNTDVFDLICIHKTKSPLCFYGIHENNNSFGVSDKRERIDKDLTKLKNFHRDTVYVKGQIHGSLEEDEIFTAYIINDVPYENNYDRTVVACVQENGTFLLKYSVPGPVWNDVNIKTKNRVIRIPFIAVPGDTAKISVNNVEFGNTQVTYGDKWCQKYQRLLKHAPLYSAHIPFFYDEKEVCPYSEFRGRKLSDELRTNVYVAEKYGLSCEELRLLNNRSRVAYAYGMTMDVTMREKDSVTDASNYKYLQSLKGCDADYILLKNYHNLTDYFLKTNAVRKYISRIADTLWKDYTMADRDCMKDITQFTGAEPKKDFFAQSVVCGMSQLLCRLSEDMRAHVMNEKMKLLTKHLHGITEHILDYSLEGHMNYYPLNPLDLQNEKDDALSEIFETNKDKYIQLVFLPDGNDSDAQIKMLDKLVNIRYDFANSEFLKLVFIGKDCDGTREFACHFLKGEECHLLGDREYASMLVKLGQIGMRKTQTITPDGNILNVPLNVYDETSFRYNLRKLLEKDTESKGVK